MNKDFNTLELLSISSAARKLAIGKDTMYRLINEGKIGFIQIGKRKKITFSELLRFQNDNTQKIQQQNTAEILSPLALNNIFNLNPKQNKTLNGKVILSKIMRR